MSDFFCPICDGELPGPVPICPHCKSPTELTQAPTTNEVTPDAGAAAEPIPPPPSAASPAVDGSDDAAPGHGGADGSEAPIASDGPPDVEVIDEIDEVDVSESVDGIPTAPGVTSAPPAGVPPPPPPTVLGVPTAPPPSTAPSSTGQFRPLPHQLQAPGGPGKPPMWAQPRVWIAAGVAVLLIVVLAIVAAGGGGGDSSDADGTQSQDEDDAVATADTTSPETTTVTTAEETTSTSSSTTTTSSTTSTTVPRTTTSTVPIEDIQGTDDLPGTPVAVGARIRSQLNDTTRPREVFALALEPGQKIQILVSMPNGGSVTLVNPGALTLTQSYSTALSGGTDSDGSYSGTFVAAVGGTYGVVIQAQGAAQTYRLDIRSGGNPVPALQGGDDIPGAPLTVDGTVRSVVDRDTRPHEVFALDVAAGQQLKLTLNMSNGGSLLVVNPGALSLTQSYSTAVSGSTDSNGAYTTPFTPAVAGTYFVVVIASGSGETYTLQVSAASAPLAASQGADDFPGAPLALGTTVQSIVDRDTRRSEVYAVELTAGQVVKLTLNMPAGGSLELVNPGAVSVEQSYTRALSGSTSSGKFVASFTPAVTGTYSIIVHASGTGETYDLLVSPTGVVMPALAGSDDIPGVAIAVGGTVQSVVDRYTRPNEVYALDLAGGQQVKITLEMPQGGNLVVANPDAVSVTQSYTRAMSGGTSSGKFVGILVPAVSGTYWVIVQASESGEPYTLTIGPP